MRGTEIARGNRAVVDDVLRRFGSTFGDAIGFDVASRRPESLFQLLFTSILACSGTSEGSAIAAGRELRTRGLASAERLSMSSWGARRQMLEEAGLERSQERLSFVLGSVADRVHERYGGNLTRLRERANRDPESERIMLQELRGVDDLPADAFFREVQVVWDEHYPFVDERALAAARKLGLPDDPQGLAPCVAREDLPRLACGLARVEARNAYESVGSDLVV